jgi:hypothetical protein
MKVTPTDLYAFGSLTGPRPPRLNIDIVPDGAGMVGPEAPPFPNGASVFADPMKAPLRKNYHRLPAGTQLPEGLEVVADGKEVDSKSLHGFTHHTIYPAIRMPSDQFLELVKNLPWQHAGYKR